MTTTVWTHGETAAAEKRPKRRRGLAVFAVLFLTELATTSVSPAFAQRRRAEPSANPSFQKEVSQSRKTGGGPISGSAPVGSSRSSGGDRMQPPSDLP
ncbi:MAG: hypothetical protein COB53_08920, partial [Elusimicrobia bacterium]